MKKNPPSIFNDVIGPVMRGPSSSHTAAAVRIGRLVREYLGGHCRACRVEFSTNGSLATTYKSQGSDFGLVGGLLGMETSDPNLTEAIALAKKSGPAVTFEIKDYYASHPNIYRITAVDGEGQEYRFIFVSTGGGMIELQEINGIAIEIHGDCYETIALFDEVKKIKLEKYGNFLRKKGFVYEDLISASSGRQTLLEIKSTVPLSRELKSELSGLDGAQKIVSLSPVLPVVSRKMIEVPFRSESELLGFVKSGQWTMAQLAFEYESRRGAITREEVADLGKEMIRIMRQSLSNGLKGYDYHDRILASQANLILNYSGNLVGGELIKKVIASITAIMETKSAMGVIVAAPTAGSCAALPGTMFAVAGEREFPEDKILEGLLAAGLIGILIAAQSTFAAEECGCQAECGSASGMTAAALVQMAGGSVKQSLDAASLALQNIFGLVCDPVANRVEVPCLGKNILAGLNAVASADMILAGFDAVIPLGQTIAAFNQVGRMLPPELRCTGLAGLSVTPVSLALAKKLDHKQG